MRVFFFVILLIANVFWSAPLPAQMFGSDFRSFRERRPTPQKLKKTVAEIQAEKLAIVHRQAEEQLAAISEFLLNYLDHQPMSMAVHRQLTIDNLPYLVAAAQAWKDEKPSFRSGVESLARLVRSSDLSDAQIRKVLQLEDDADGNRDVARIRQLGNSFGDRSQSIVLWVSPDLVFPPLDDDKRASMSAEEFEKDLQDTSVQALREAIAENCKKPEEDYEPKGKRGNARFEFDPGSGWCGPRALDVSKILNERRIPHYIVSLEPLRVHYQIFQPQRWVWDGWSTGWQTPLDPRFPKEADSIAIRYQNRKGQEVFEGARSTIVMVRTQTGRFYVASYYTEREPILFQDFVDRLPAKRGLGFDLSLLPIFWQPVVKR